MAFEGGWVCRSCWKPNRPGDTKCYRCKTERDADRSTIETSRREREAANAQLEQRAAKVPDAAVIIPAGLFAWLGRFTGLSVIVLAIGAMIAVADGRATDGLVVGLFTIGYTAATFAMRWISREMRVGNPVAFAGGLAISVALAGLALWILTMLRAYGLPSYQWFQLMALAIYGSSAISSLVGLLYALRGDDHTQPA